MRTSWPNLLPDCQSAALLFKFASNRWKIGNPEILHLGFWLLTLARFAWMHFYLQKQKHTMTMSYCRKHWAWKLDANRHVNCTSKYLLYKHPQKKTESGAKHILMTLLELNLTWRYLLARLFGDFVHCRTTRTWTQHLHRLGVWCSTAVFLSFLPFPDHTTSYN